MTALTAALSAIAVARSPLRLGSRFVHSAGDNGRSEISMEDFAVALLNEIEQGRHVGQRFTAAW
jgi:putative NADH-flavin reductase